MPSSTFDEVRLGLARLPKQTPLSIVFDYACEQSAKALHVARVGIWLFVENRSALRCVNLYELYKNEHSAGATLRVADYPRYFESLNSLKSVPAEVAREDPRTAELAENYMSPLGISSMLDAGLFVGGQLVGVLCHEHVGLPLKFSQAARDFASSIADLVAARIQTAELQELKNLFLTQEKLLLASEKTEALAQMAAGVAHDFNNILTVITGRAELLRAALQSPEGEEHLVPLLDAAEKGRLIVRELLDFAKPEKTGPTSVIDLCVVLNDFLPMIRSAMGYRHNVRLNLSTQTALVLMGKTQFCRVAFNLALNARDAMPEGGTILLRLASVKTTDSGGTALHYILFEVTDHGIGMDAATRERLGEPYFTTKSEGTGLGLAIVKKNLSRAGGLFQVDSEPGVGTTIRIFLPRVGSSTGDTTEFPMLDVQRTNGGITD